jgi:hypothetical protein
MRTNRIVCVKSEHPHRHIVSVGIGDSAGTPMITKSVDAVRRDIDAGDVFETYSPSTGKLAKVKKDSCGKEGCQVNTIRSNADAVADNNLDNLPVCR